MNNNQSGNQQVVNQGGTRVYNTIPTINPADPNGQLNQQGTCYNVNGSNQPLATNIANELKAHYRAGNSGLSRTLFTLKIETFLLNHFLVNDPNSYTKVMERVNVANGERPN